MEHMTGSGSSSDWISYVTHICMSHFLYPPGNMSLLSLKPTEMSTEKPCYAHHQITDFLSLLGRIILILPKMTHFCSYLKAHCVRLIPIALCCYILTEGKKKERAQLIDEPLHWSASQGIAGF